ncbi:MAG: DUF1638 domain-containing protein [Spirochaetes bacterium]|nr:DUF1638 domain-containing protein [Spirochaetota bacterium]
MREKIIGCRVLARELYYCASRSPHRIGIELYKAGLHERPEKLNRFLKDAIAKTTREECDRILLSYGLCGNGTLEVTHPDLPIAVHNCHDCIPLLFGDKRRHEQWIKKTPGTFFYSCGWIDELLVPGCPDYDDKYLMLYNKTITKKQRNTVERILVEHYSVLAYIHWDELGDALGEKGRRYTKACCASLNDRFDLGLRYEEVSGGPTLIQAFVDGRWNDDVVVVEPGKKLLFNAPNGNLYCG